MKMTKSISLTSTLLVVLSGCSNQIRDDNLILDYDWKPDVYNLVMVEVADADNVQFWVRRAPEYAEGSPHHKACVEVAEPTEPNRFFIANLNTYGLTEVKSCEGDFSAASNLVSPKDSRAFGGDEWQNVYGVSTSVLDNSNLLLKFESLFPVNEYQLTNEGRATLFATIEELQKWPVESLTVYGVADSSGDYETNRFLADKRSKVTRDFLIEEGLRNVPIYIRGSVENGLSTPKQRVTQRRFMIEVKLKKYEK
ncbi:outer membrane protein [Vibrio zhanjiangensis]|uniref:Outer membrane protein n=1 Tax=Vibrio zhanjiangensis TaxID=1046128 RepID=A0ABQ6EW91_9VIBR|nr:OmpA family protein [Vibrio zhanjiangensis]GLT17467.1 outer membrane protein [Vibrio zhanjiangensis]